MKKIAIFLIICAVILMSLGLFTIYNYPKEVADYDIICQKKGISEGADELYKSEYTHKIKLDDNNNVLFYHYEIKYIYSDLSLYQKNKKLTTNNNALISFDDKKQTIKWEYRNQNIVDENKENVTISIEQFQKELEDNGYSCK